MESLKKAFSKAQLLTVFLLLAWIAVGEYVFHIAGLPTWPMFTCMVSFFLAEQKKEEIIKIVVGAMTGEFMIWVLVTLWMPATASTLGSFPAQLIFVLVFVGCIVLFGSVLPWFLNSFTFLFFLVAALGKPFSPFLWMAISAVGGTIIILGCVVITKIVIAASTQKNAA